MFGFNNTSTLLGLLQGEQSNTDMSKQALLRGESVGKKRGKSVSREKCVCTIVSEFKTQTDNGHTCLDYMLEG